MSSAGGQQKISLPGAKNVLAIASGKGGVGKSTVATVLPRSKFSAELPGLLRRYFDGNRQG